MTRIHLIVVGLLISEFGGVGFSDVPPASDVHQTRATHPTDRCQTIFHAQSNPPPNERGVRVNGNGSTAPSISESSRNADALAQNWRHSSQFEIELWDLVRKKNIAADYEAYLEMYPSGSFAAEARRRASVLRAAPAVTPKTLNSKAIEERLRLSHLERVLIQHGLNVLGADAGQPDGAIGARTRRAIQTYQIATGATETGYLTFDQASALIGAGKRAMGAKKHANRASHRSSNSKPSEESAAYTTSPAMAPADPPLNREAIRNAIVDFMINVGSDNCWGNRYFCYFDDLRIKSIDKDNGARIRVTSRYSLLSSETLQESADKRDFESEFLLLNEGTTFRVTSIHTDAKFKKTEDRNVPDTTSE